MANLTVEQRRTNTLLEKAIAILERADKDGVPMEYKHFLIALADRYISLANMGG